MTSAQSSGPAAQPRSKRLPSSGFAVQVLVWSIVAVCFGAVIWFWCVGPVLSRLDSIASDSPIPDKSVVETPTPQLERPAVPSRADEKLLTSPKEVERLGRQAAARSRRIAIESDVTRISTRLDEIDQLDSMWTSDIARLSSEDDGRRIAGSPVQLERYAVLLKRKCPVNAEPDSLRQRLQALQATFNATSEGTILERIPNSVEALDRLLSDSARLVEFLRERDRMLDAIVEDSREIPPADSSLSEALAGFLAERESENVRLIAERIADAKQESTSQVAVAEESKKQAESDLRNARRQLAESGSPAPVDSTDVSSSERQVTRAEFQAELPAIRQLLSPFISPGYVQPVTSTDFRQSTSKSPVSLSVLKKSGALDADDKGLLALLRIGGSRQEGRANDRPLGSFPQFHSELDLSKSRIRASLTRAQTLLRDYGEFMIEDGLLDR